MTTASVDRIDSSIGYVMGNIQWVHKDINKMKSDFSQELFIAWCGLVASHQQGTNWSGRKTKRFEPPKPLTGAAASKESVQPSSKATQTK